MRALILLAVLMAAAMAEIVDRIAVTVGNSVVTMSEVTTQVRVAALIDGKPIAFDEESLRSAANRLVEQTLLRREMLLADYQPAGVDAAKPVLERWKVERFSDDDSRYRQALAEYDVSEDRLLEQLQWQVTLLRFIDQRFRPGVQVPAEDVRAYYRGTFVPNWRGPEGAQPPPLPEVANAIEDTIAAEQLNSLVDRWLNSSRSQLDILFRDEAFLAQRAVPQ